MKRRSSKGTPVRAALVSGSILLPEVQDGLDALKGAHKNYLHADVRADLDDSLDLDAALQPGHPGANRWDYLLGHGPSGRLVALEPHSARSDQVSTVIAKRAAALEQLRGHLRDGVHVATWLWVASGSVDFPDTVKEAKRLAQNGVAFAGRQVSKKHLPAELSKPEGRGRGTKSQEARPSKR